MWQQEKHFLLLFLVKTRKTVLLLVSLSICCKPHFVLPEHHRFCRSTTVSELVSLSICCKPHFVFDVFPVVDTKLAHFTGIGGIIIHETSEAFGIVTTYRR